MELVNKNDVSIEIEKDEPKFNSIFDEYEEKIRFKISEKEVDGIEKGVASIVQTLATRAILHCEDELKGHLEALQEWLPGLEMLNDVESTLIKVGSFYEKTKIGFPDEFDFLFPIYIFKSHADETSEEMHTYRLKDYMKNVHETFHDAIKHCLETGIMTTEHISYKFRNRILVFEELVEMRGPSSKLKLRYKSKIGYTRDVFVDLVPCLKITFQATQTLASMKLRPLHCKEFEPSVISEGTFSIVDSDNLVSFVEAELSFMKEVLSDKHKKVYMILKYLANGHGDNEKLRKEFDKKGLCSYFIKCAMIYHHFECKRLDNEVDACVLTILRNILKDSKDTNHVTLLTGWQYVGDHVHLALKQLLRNLEKNPKTNAPSVAKSEYIMEVEATTDNVPECCYSCLSNMPGSNKNIPYCCLSCLTCMDQTFSNLVDIVRSDRSILIGLCLLILEIIIVITDIYLLFVFL